MLEDIYLTKEELPILNERCFVIPIHPILLDPRVKIDKTLASKSFAKTADDWYNDLKKHRNTATLEKETQQWYDRILRQRPSVIEKHGKQSLDTIACINTHQLAENGFCTAFNISRDFGGGLQFYENDSSCRQGIFSRDGPSKYVLFSKEKAQEFNIKDNLHPNILIANTYSLQNIDSYPGALFLRNWAINYMNMAFEDIKPISL